MSGTLPAIFISYSRTDMDFVDRLEADLQARQFQTWVDRRGLEAGLDWLDQLQSAIDQCQVLVLVLSPDAAQSKYVRMEYRYAREIGKLVIPLQCQPTSLIPIDLRTIQWINFYSNYETGLLSLLARLGYRSLIVSTTPNTTPSPPQEVKAPASSSASNPTESPPTESTPLAAPSPAAYPPQHQPGQGAANRGIDFDNAPTNTFSDFFNALFGPHRGRDIEQHVSISLAEAYSGIKRTFAIETPEICFSCQGTGKTGKVIKKTCATCNGRGEVTLFRRHIEATIPAGVDNGSKVYMPGEGHPSINGGPPGDLFLIVEVYPDPNFRRNGNDLFMNVTVTPSIAKKGGEVPVIFPDGTRVLLTIRPDTPDGQEYRLTSKGMPNLDTGVRGNSYARVLIIPD